VLSVLDRLVDQSLTSSLQQTRPVHCLRHCSRSAFFSLDPAGSPTEIATTASSPTPRSPRLSTGNSFAPENIKDIVKDDVNDATDGRSEVFYDKITLYVEDRRKEADVELQDILDEHRLDITEDELADFARVVDEALLEYQDTVHAFKEDAELGTSHDTARCQGKYLLDQGRQSLQDIRKLLDEEGQFLHNESKLPDGEQQHLEYERRHCKIRGSILHSAGYFWIVGCNFWSMNRVLVLQHNDY
jgi:hypothetical protein